jgi:predicted polyphosphate/ATP-dependent NAD kinase
MAGIGGRVGLKGSDGAGTVARALELGATPEAPARAREAIGYLKPLGTDLEILTYGGSMGEDAATWHALDPIVIGGPSDGGSTASDTRAAAAQMVEAGVDLILFAGGDGTARDMLDAVGQRVTVLGIPAGVKIHSAAYAINPHSAGQLAALYLGGGPQRRREAEVMDIDEEAFRAGRLSAELHGFLLVPFDERRLQPMKAGRGTSEGAAMEQIATRIVESMEPSRTYFIGPGTTTRAIKDRLGPGGTLLGVDVFRDGRLIKADANERQLLEVLDGAVGGVDIIVTVIGGQGYVFGRGNQQLSPAVIRRVGREHIRVVATRDKLVSLGLRPLLADTGAADVDAMLSGYIRVAVGYGEDVVAPIEA